MDAKTSFLVLEKIQSRLNGCQILSKEDFMLINTGSYNDFDELQLRGLVKVLFEEHTLVTSLINDVYSLRSALSKFDL